MGCDERRALEVAYRIAAHGLGAPVHRMEPPLADGEWPAVLTCLDWQRLCGLAVAAVDDGALELPAEGLDELRRHHRDRMLWSLALERRLVSVSSAFEEDGIEVVVLKGPALANTHYPDPSWRPFGDIDLLVRTRDWQLACDLLPHHGFHRKLPEPRPGFARRFGNAATHRSPEGLEIDLHRTLAAGPFGLWMEPEELFEETATFPLGGRKMRRLDDTALLLHACVHASLGFRPPLLLPLRDVAQILSRAAIEWDRLREWARRWRLRAVMRHALDAVSELGFDPPPQAWAIASEEPSRQELNALAAYVTDRRTRSGRAIATMRAIPGLRGKLAYASGMLVPTRQFQVARSGSAGPAGYVRRWVVAASRIRPGRRTSAPPALGGRPPSPRGGRS